MSTRKDEIRAKAQAARDARQNKERSSRLVLQFSIIGVILAFVAIAAVVIVTSTAASKANTPANLAGGGVRFENTLVPVSTLASDDYKLDTNPLATDKPDVRVYIDYMCPFCNQFEQSYGSYLSGLVEAGTINLEYHPIAILDRLSQGTKYSTRAAAASACVAAEAPEQWFGYNNALFANQPAENSEGLTDQQLVDIAKNSGVSNADVEECILEGKNIAWAKKNTLSATSKLPFVDQPLSSTPTVMVNGKLFDGSSDFTEYLNSVIAD